MARILSTVAYHRRMMRDLLTRAGLAAGVLTAFVSCGGDCPFGATQRTPFEGTIGCCGAAVQHTMGAGRDGEFDMSSVEYPGQPTYHAYLTEDSCTSLFSGTTYPPAAGSGPNCPVLLGPITPGTISRRIHIEQRTTLRVHVFAFTASTAPAPYKVEVVRWENSCRGDLQ
jgi:hypothetical protein